MGKTRPLGKTGLPFSVSTFIEFLFPFYCYKLYFSPSNLSREKEYNRKGVPPAAFIKQGGGCETHLGTRTLSFPSIPT
jgi:hypothetical protein